MMPKLNILIVGNEFSKSAEMLTKSKYINKLYGNFEFKNIIQIEFNTFKELAIKCKSLKIDIVVVEDEKMVTQGIADVLKRNFVNCIALNSYWTNLILDTKFARKMLAKYDLNTPEILSYPKEFPVVIRGNGILEIANSLEETLHIKQNIAKQSNELAQTIFLEKYIEGDVCILTSIFDGKNLITFTKDKLTQTLINNYNNKLETMFLEENKNFIGYINARVIASKNKLYILSFNLDFPELEKDLVYILISAIYQKLDEVEL